MRLLLYEIFSRLTIERLLQKHEHEFGILEDCMILLGLQKNRSCIGKSFGYLDSNLAM